MNYDTRAVHSLGARIADEGQPMREERVRLAELYARVRGTTDAEKRLAILKRIYKEGFLTRALWPSFLQMLDERGEVLEVKRWNDFLPPEVWSGHEPQSPRELEDHCREAVKRYDFLDPIVRILEGATGNEPGVDVATLLGFPRIGFERIVHAVQVRYPLLLSRFKGIMDKTLARSRELQRIHEEYQRIPTIDLNQVVDYARCIWSLGSCPSECQKLVTSFFINCLLDHEKFMFCEEFWLIFSQFLAIAGEGAGFGSIAGLCCPGSLKIRLNQFMLQNVEGCGWLEILSQAQDIMSNYEPEPEDVENAAMQLQMFHAFRHYSPDFNLFRGRAHFVKMLLREHMYGLRDTKEQIQRLWMCTEYSLGKLKRARKIVKRLAQNERLRFDADFWIEVARCEGPTGKSSFAILLEEILPQALQAGKGEFLGRAWADLWKVIDTYGAPSEKKAMQSLKGHLLLKGIFGVAEVANSPTARLPAEASQPAPSDSMDMTEVILDPKTTVYLGNLSYRASEAEIARFMEQELGLGRVHVVLGRDGGGNSRGFAHVVLASSRTVHDALGHDRVMFLGRPLFISSYQPVPSAQRQRIRYSDERDPTTLFISHLSLATTKEDLEDVFGAYEGLVDVRLIISKGGHFKCAAYVQFESEKSAAAALACNGREVRGQTIRVQVSDPVAAKNKAAVLAMRPRSVKPKPKLDTSSSHAMSIDQ